MSTIKIGAAFKFVFFPLKAGNNYTIIMIFHLLPIPKKGENHLNSRQLQYAILLSKIRNFSAVAEKLNISQPALSKQILSLEKDLGVRLFDRDCIPLRVTPAGEHFIQEAQSLLYQEEQLLKTMERFRTGEEGRLTIGISPFRSLYLMPRIVRGIRKRYPGVQVRLCEAYSDQLRQGAAEGKYDFAVVNLPVDESLLEVTPVEPDTLVLAVPDAMLPLLPRIPEGKLPELDLAECRNVPFVVVSPGQEMRQLFDRLCAISEVHLKIAAEVVGVSTAWAMTRAGVGASLLPLQFVGPELFDNQVSLFTIRGNIFIRQPVVVTRRGQYLSEYAKYAIELLTKPPEE